MLNRIVLPSLFVILFLLSSCGGSDNEPGTDTTSSASTSVMPAGERFTVDRPDDESGPQVHLMYVLPSDGADRRLDTDGTIQRSFETAERWLSGETGGRTLRLDRYQGEADVSFFTLSRSDADVQAEGAFARELIEGEIRSSGFDAAGKIYAVYYDGGSTYACGSGAWPPNLVGTVATLFLRGLPRDGAIRCGDNAFATNVDTPQFWEYVAVHEIMHTLGFVPTCSPNETLEGHISGPPNDLMYEGDEESDPPKALDAGHDDYYKAGIPGCLDLSDSDYLTP